MSFFFTFSFSSTLSKQQKIQSEFCGDIFALCHFQTKSSVKNFHIPQFVKYAWPAYWHVLFRIMERPHAFFGLRRKRTLQRATAADLSIGRRRFLIRKQTHLGSSLLFFHLFHSSLQAGRQANANIIPRARGTR